MLCVLRFTTWLLDGIVQNGSCMPVLLLECCLEGLVSSGCSGRGGGVMGLVLISLFLIPTRAPHLRDPQDEQEAQRQQGQQGSTIDSTAQPELFL
jgi:hypothetical protein